MLKNIYKFGILILTTAHFSCGNTDTKESSNEEAAQNPQPPSSADTKNETQNKVIEDKKPESKEGRSGETTDEDQEKDNTATDCPKYPLVFHHGFMGGKKMGTFVGVDAQFKKRGCKVLVTEVAAVDTAEVRAKQLKTQIDDFLTKTGAAKVHIIAHSQGGLDARYAISKLNLGDIVASLSTISTPHRGTKLADIALDKTSPLAQKALVAMINIMGTKANSSSPDPDTLAAIKSMSVSYMEGTFNNDVKDVSGVIYQSWGSQTGSDTKDKVKALLFIPNMILKNNGGMNDGVVAVDSAKWGTYNGTLDADHLDLIGIQILDFLSPFKHSKFLDGLVDDLIKKKL
jgi:triacylglycerol lipase